MKIFLGVMVLSAFTFAVVSLSKSSGKPLGADFSSWMISGNFHLAERSDGVHKPTHFEHDGECGRILSPEMKQKIRAYQGTVDQIIKHVIQDHPGETWRQLADFVDRHGPRFTGTRGLELAIDDRLDFLRRVAGPGNVVEEPVRVPVWHRGETEVVLLNAWSGNRNKTMEALTLGYSVGTPEPEGLTAEAVVVESFAELDSLSNVSGKIVVFNQDYVSYEETMIYRTEGASRAAAKGAVAALIRSVTDFSLYTPHTGYLNYARTARKIPGISITVEDAELLWRKQLRGEKLKMFLRSTATTTGTAESRNLVATIPGRSHPEEFVIVSGHIDSWDVGQGAMDDGGGAAIAWRALEVLKELQLTPQRTMKTVLFTSEEMGYIGGEAFFQKHKANARNAQIIMESDIGTFTPLGLSTGIRNKKSVCMIKEVLKLFKSINATALDPQNEGPDITYWLALGVPLGSLFNKNGDYFKYHHTNADTMSMMDSSSLDKATALWTGVAFVLADLDERIPHERIGGGASAWRLSI